MPNKKNLDSVITICGYTFDVTEEDVDKEPGDEGTCGDSDVVHKWIRLQPDIPLDTKIETFYHEVGHMWLGITGLEHLLTKELEETLCQSFGAFMAKFITENKNLPRLEE